MKFKSAAIIVPLFKSSLTDTEEVSISRCFSIWADKYDIYFVKPVTLNLQNIEKAYPCTGVISFDPSFFKGKEGYNRLMFSPLFYEKFLDYQYILIYQADGYVFRDELEYWCSLGYDYIGAPWIPKNRHSKWWYRIIVCLRKFLLKLKSYRDRDIQYYNVGNGGVSLRKTSIFYKIAREDREKIVSCIKMLGRYSMFNEDIYWSLEGKTASGKRLYKPDYHKALEFSFDMNPDISYKLNKNRLPFCCHGFSHPRHSKFWRQFIEF
ncbi:MAG: DUF5672 family protein [Bacteroidales bacterium]|nr:hypothetical protein [Bacteroidales bacterium]MDD2425411.1 DUF5672 family protein [Bacteroidales bacterium]MDD3988807.1 DUF5672 family protein [Bacteroidales bacterium]MDD4639507.1 DUF5672 family protein [Bacteroidales bacterium]